MCESQSMKTRVALAHSPEIECEDICRNGESIQAKKTQAIPPTAQNAIPAACCCRFHPSGFISSFSLPPRSRPVGYCFLTHEWPEWAHCPPLVSGPPVGPV